MSFAADLLARFNNISLSAGPSNNAHSLRNRHVLTFHYPCHQLIPENGKNSWIYLDQSSNMDFRPDPRGILNEVHCVDTSFFVVLPPFPEFTTAEPRTPRPGTAESTITGPNELIDAVETMTRTSSSTRLELVRWFDRKRGDIRTKFLLTNEHDRSHDAKTFVLTEVQWKDFLSRAVLFAWSKVLTHLIFRSSVAAFKHVQDRLAGVKAGRITDAGSLTEWNSFAPLFPHIQGVYETLFATQAEELPAYLQKQKSFKDLDTIELWKSEQEYHFPANHIYDALKLTYDSMLTPEQVRPQNIALETLPESRLATNALES